VKQPKITDDRAPDGRNPVRERVLSAAFSSFMKRGFVRTSTLEIATRAKVSKRELYALFDSKQAMLAACITARAKRMRLAVELITPQDRDALAMALTEFGTAILRGVCEPSVLAVYRLAIAESEDSPEIGRVLDDAGRKANRTALIDLLAKAQADGLLGSDEAATMAELFFALLWGDLLVRLLLRVTNTPNPGEIGRRARAAAETLLALYPGATSREKRS
jgi:AcrR family transcriptional regulator